ncbi:hypothetical protein AUP68_09643 [Ilyonectria robusta]
MTTTHNYQERIAMATIPDYQKLIAKEFLGTTSRPFVSYFKVYDQLRAGAVHIEQPQLGDFTPPRHHDVVAAAQLVRSDPQKPLQRIITDLQGSLTHIQPGHQARFVVFMAIRAMFMLDPAVADSHGEGFRIGHYRPISWQPSESFQEFVLNSLPKASVTALDDIKSIKAWKLKSRFGIKFMGTDNITKHLLLDVDNKVLYLFHHTSYLNAHLRRSEASNVGQEELLVSCLERGSLPPRLLSETLHSIQDILFHWRDEKSLKLLEGLIKKKGFDADCAEKERSEPLREYLYWGERLAVLHDLVINRPPRNKFERWVKWQTSESNAFIVALGALVISIIVGVLSLGLSGLQVWIAWRAWKDATNPDGGPETA